MIAGRRIFCLIACIVLAANTELRGNDSPDSTWRCPQTEDGTCIPNPRSYGYYPTRWRKWPGAKQEAASTTKSATPEAEGSKQAPTTGSEEAPTDETPRSGTGDDQPDMMPSDPTRPASRPDLPPELKSDLPQPPDLESLLPEEGPGEAPSPPPATRNQPRSPPPATRPEPKTIPSDDDPFKDDPLPSEDMGGADHPPSPPAPTTTGKIHWRPDPRLKQAARVSEAKNPIVLADAQNIREPGARPLAITSTSPARFAPSHTNPLRSATSGMVLPGPMADADEVVPAANWSLEDTTTQAPAAAEGLPAAAQSSGTVWRSNPLRAAR